MISYVCCYVTVPPPQRCSPPCWYRSPPHQPPPTVTTARPLAFLILTFGYFCRYVPNTLSVSPRVLQPKLPKALWPVGCPPPIMLCGSGGRAVTGGTGLWGCCAGRAGGAITPAASSPTALHCCHKDQVLKRLLGRR